MKNRRISLILAGLFLFVLLFVSNLLGILTDKQKDARQYYMESGNVAIELTVDTGSDDPVLIVPNQTTPLSIKVTNTGTKDCYIFVKTVIPTINNYPILSISPTGSWIKIEEEDNVYQYVKDGIAGVLASGDDTADLVAEAKFYDFDTLVDFRDEVQVMAYAVQTDGFSSDAAASDIWTTVIQAAGD